MSDYLDPNNEELLKDFFVEAQAQVELLEQNILALERNPHDLDSVDEIFRAAHTLKGAAATVQMGELASFTHLLEDVLDRVRSHELEAGESVIDPLLQAIDVVKLMLQARSENTIFDDDISELTGQLEALRGTSKAAASRPSSVAAAPVGIDVEGGTELVGLSEYELLEIQQASGSDMPLYCVSISFDESNPMNSVGGIQIYAALREYGELLKTTPELDRLYEDTFYPTVDYYLASSRNPEEIRKAVLVPDVTLEAGVKKLGTEDVSAKSVTPAPSASSRGPGTAFRPERSDAERPGETGTGPRAEAREIPARPVGPGGTAGSGRPAESGAGAGSGGAASERAVPATAAHENAQSAASRVAGVEQAAADAKHQAVVGSVLRVDSRRIDNLLNLVSETVINKAAFNQINTQFAENLTQLQNASLAYRQRVRELLDWLAEAIASPGAANGAAGPGGFAGVDKDVRREVSAKFGDLLSLLDPLDSSLKSTAAKLRNNVQNLTRITSDLQEGVMRIRMVPISQVFSRFPRLVRDLSRSLNKKIELVIEGEDTELDKSVIEDLLDPLIHCVRNSIDHGIEAPDARRAAGKDEAGRLLLRAANEGNTVTIEIADDGKGIDAEKVHDRAVERGIIHPSKVLSDVEVFNLIFEPGFSTSTVVTNISGRGVGLDVVRKQIEKLSGTVTVASEPGRGTRFTIRIPLTLAIIQGLLVRVGPEMYAIPISSVIESHRIRPSEIRLIDNYEVFNVREDVVSLLRLNRLFRIPSAEQREHYFVVVVASGERKIGLVVDSLIGEEDVVIKPLKDQYTDSPGIAGANITGDGTVCLIIDVARLVELGLRREREERKKRQAVIR